MGKELQIELLFPKYPHKHICKWFKLPRQGTEFHIRDVGLSEREAEDVMAAHEGCQRYRLVTMAPSNVTYYDHIATLEPVGI